MELNNQHSLIGEKYLALQTVGRLLAVLKLTIGLNVTKVEPSYGVALNCDGLRSGIISVEQTYF